MSFDGFIVGNKRNCNICLNIYFFNSQRISSNNIIIITEDNFAVRTKRLQLTEMTGKRTSSRAGSKRIPIRCRSLSLSASKAVADEIVDNDAGSQDLSVEDASGPSAIGGGVIELKRRRRRSKSAGTSKRRGSRKSKSTSRRRRSRLSRSRSGSQEEDDVGEMTNDSRVEEYYSEAPSDANADDSIMSRRKRRHRYRQRQVSSEGVRRRQKRRHSQSTGDGEDTEDTEDNDSLMVESRKGRRRRRKSSRGKGRAVSSESGSAQARAASNKRKGGRRRSEQSGTDTGGDMSGGVTKAKRRRRKRRSVSAATKN